MSYLQLSRVSAQPLISYCSLISYCLLSSTPWARWAAVSNCPVRAAVSSSSVSTRTSSATVAASATSSPTSSASGSCPSPAPRTTTSTCRARHSRRPTSSTRSAGVACACWTPPRSFTSEMTSGAATAKKRSDQARARCTREEIFR